MKKRVFMFCCALGFLAHAWGQGEQNIWVFGDVAGLNFNTPIPTTLPNNFVSGNEGCASVCNAAGQLLFYTNGCWVWNSSHEIMPELTGGLPGITAPVYPTAYPPMMPYTGSFATQPAAITGMPAHPGKYYIFSLSGTGQLYYSIVNMSMNGGSGGIVPGKKSIPLEAGLAEKLTVVKGCNNIWVMARSKNSNQYHAFEVNDTGVVTTPVVSNVGLMPTSWYRCGVIKCSPDGQRMAAACNDAFGIAGGLELYDFNPATGKLSNPVILDSSSKKGYYYGACFSQDNSKLYASVSSFAYGGTFYYGKVRQFDVSLGSIAAIIASNTIVFTDAVLQPDNIGDLKRSINGKIYFGSGRPFQFLSPFMHSINTPNNAGLACNVTPNSVALNAGMWSYRGLPNDVVILPAPDTVRVTKQVAVCFKDSVLLSADTGKWYRWENGSLSRKRAINQSGLYIVGYVNAACNYEIDSFNVRFIAMPVAGNSGYGCPGEMKGKAWVKPSDTTTFTYQWKDASGNLLRQVTSNKGDTLKGIDTGTYYVQLITPSGCDTSLRTVIPALPKPVALITGDTFACKGQEIRLENASVAPIANWHFGDGTFSNNKVIYRSYPAIGDYTTKLIVQNIEGCRDTALHIVHVDGLTIQLFADRDFIEIGETVQLSATATTNFQVLGWLPANIIKGQNDKQQQLELAHSTRFTVIGQSVSGCVDSASLLVSVNPKIVLPTAFTPNGDGVNDLFRLVSTEDVTVRYFVIYNRYGQQVYNAYGSAAKEGWDGKCSNNPCNIGTYYYQLILETAGGNSKNYKGDVTLVR